MIGAAAIAWNYRDTQLEKKRLEPSIQKYASLKAKPISSTSRATYSGGKVVCVNMNDRCLDPIHFDLPGDLRATRPEEVAAIAQITYTVDVVGKYKNSATGIDTGRYATRESAQCVIIDAATGDIIESTAIIGGQPAKTIASGERDKDMGRPVNALEIAAWIKYSLRAFRPH